MDIRKIFYFFLLVFLISPLKAENKKNQNKVPIGVCFVNEMELIPEVDSWKSYREAIDEEWKSGIKKVWKKRAFELQKYLSPQLVADLSGYSKELMKKYEEVPSLANVELTPITSFRGFLVLKGTVDTLPSHPLVQRWLEVYVICDKEGRRIHRVTITIRGERHE